MIQIKLKINFYRFLKKSNNQWQQIDNHDLKYITQLIEDMS